MPGDVGEGLLHDAVGGAVDLGREAPDVTLHVDGQLDARGPGPPGELVHPGEAGPGVHHVRAEHLQRGAEFPHRLAARLLDGQEGRFHLGAPLAGEVDGDTGLELHDRDGVGERVVELAGDAQPLLTGATQGGLLPGPFGVQGALLGLAQIGLPVLVDQAGDTGAQEPAREEQHSLHGVLDAGHGDEQHHGVGGEEHRPHPGRLGAVPVAGGRVDGHHHGQHHPAPRLGVDGVPEHAERGDAEHEARGPAVRGEREGTHRDEQHVESVG